MFDKFGEFDSFSEINELAENLLNEGDIESLKVVAKENGIQADFVDLYTHGEIPELCDKLTAALGKIDVEAAELKPKEIMEDWVEYLRGQCMENELLAHNVRKKGKYYKASAWQVSNSVLSERTYSNITLECAGEQYGLYKKFMSSEVIHLRYDNAKIRVYLESVVNQYNNTLNAINYMIRLSNQPKFKLKLGAAQSFREKQADGTDKIVTKDMYAEKIKRLLESEDGMM